MTQEKTQELIWQSESIAGEGGAEYVADNAEECGEKSLTCPYPDSVYGRDIPVSGQPNISRPVAWVNIQYR